MYMKQILLNAIMTAGRANNCVPARASQARAFIYYFILNLLFLLLISNTSIASHFKGGHFTYRYLGEGRYEILIKGYWHKSEVGNIFPRYGGSVKIHGFPLTVSKTLLPDGETVEHVQRQEVSWSQPGLYEIYWKTCCRDVGANFSNNVMGLFTVVNYNPAALSASPKFYDYFIVNFASGQPIEYSINVEDPEGHEQEYSLEIPYGSSADVYKEMLETGFQLNSDGTILWKNPVAGKWLVNVRLREKMEGNYTGAYIDREYIINIISSDSNSAPVFTPIEAKAVKAGETLSFEVEAADAEGQNVRLMATGSPFENGASFTQTVQGSLAKGTFTWTPGQDALGTYKVQFVATDSYSTPLSSYSNVAITVAECHKYTTTYSIAAKPCVGSSNGRITLSATEGISPYTYSLDNGITYQSLPDFENLAPGNYTGIVKDAIGCTSEPVNIVLEEAPLPEVTLSLPSAVCANAGTMALTGGNPAGGSYLGTGVEDGYFYPERAGIGTHTIYYTFTDSNGCSNTASQDIMVNEVPIADAGADTEVYSGAGARSCTTLTAGATGGTSPYTYTWSTGETTQSIEVCPTETTIYVLTVTDALGCSATSEVTVTVQDVRDGSINSQKPDGVGRESAQGGNTGVGANARSKTIAKNKPIAENSTNIAETTTAEVAIFPNPVTDISQLKVTLKEADMITVDIIDLSGKVVKKLYTGNIEANQELTFEINNKLGNKNFYIGRITTTKGVYSFKLMTQ